MPGSIKIDDGSGNYTILTNAGSLGSDKTITIPNTTGTVALTSDITSGLAEADLWQITANVNSSGDLTSNWARPDEVLTSYMGTGMTESSGIFSFPSTGYYLIMVQAYLSSPSSGVGSAQLNIKGTDDDFSSETTLGVNRIYQSSNNNYTTTFSEVIVDITDTSNQKIKFNFSKSGDGQIQGATSGSSSKFGFYKLGET